MNAGYWSVSNMWAAYVAVLLFMVAVACVFTALWENDGPMWAMSFITALLCALMLFA